MRKLTSKEIEYLLSYANETLITVNTMDVFDDENSGEIILESEENIENKVIRQDLFSRLSSDAKFVLQTILNSPAEMLKIANRRGNAKKKLAGYLRELWRSTLRVKKVMSELNQYNQELQC